MTASFLSEWLPGGLGASQQMLLRNKCLCPLLVSMHSQHVCVVCVRNMYCTIAN